MEAKRIVSHVALRQVPHWAKPILAAAINHATPTERKTTGP